VDELEASAQPVDDGRRDSAVLVHPVPVLKDPVLPAVFTVTAARRAGMTRGQVDGRVATGRWRRLRRGVFCISDIWDASTPEQQHVLQARGVLAARSTGGPVALSHTTAAVLLDLPSPRSALWAVHLTVPPRSAEHSRQRGDVWQHVAGLLPLDIVQIDGLPVTRPARTVADCLRMLDPFDAVPIADGGLHTQSTCVAAIREVLEKQARWPRVDVARATLALADGRRETPLESQSFVVLHRHGLPPPVPQVKICDHVGRFVARVDFAWLEKGVVGEADGQAKYLADGDPVAAFEAEKERQARLEALGLVVVRWGWRHLVGDPPPMVERLREALARGNASRFTGRAA
jgi:very-short-patch-repair endonuclease